MNGNYVTATNNVYPLKLELNSLVPRMYRE